MFPGSPAPPKEPPPDNEGLPLCKTCPSPFSDPKAPLLEAWGAEPPPRASLGIPAPSLLCPPDQFRHTLDGGHLGGEGGSHRGILLGEGDPRVGFLQGLQGKKLDSEPGLVIWPPACLPSAGRIQEAVPGLVLLRQPQVN